MSEVAVGAIILAINALGGGILLFVSGVALVGTQIHTEWLASLENKRVIQGERRSFATI